MLGRLNGETERHRRHVPPVGYPTRQPDNPLPLAARLQTSAASDGPPADVTTRVGDPEEPHGESAGERKNPQPGEAGDRAR